MDEETIKLPLRTPEQMEAIEAENPANPANYYLNFHLGLLDSLNDGFLTFYDEDNEQNSIRVSRIMLVESPDYVPEDEE